MEEYAYRMRHGCLSPATERRVRDALRKHGVRADVVSMHVHGFGDKHWFTTGKQDKVRKQHIEDDTDRALAAEGLIKAGGRGPVDNRPRGMPRMQQGAG